MPDQLQRYMELQKAAQREETPTWVAARGIAPTYTLSDNTVGATYMSASAVSG